MDRFLHGTHGGFPITIPAAVVYCALPLAWVTIFVSDQRSFEKYGLQVKKWSENLDKLVTHCLVHGSQGHVAGTAVGYLSAVAVWLAMQQSSALQMPFVDACAAVSASVVSGVVGGVGATLIGLYAERYKFVNDHKWGNSWMDSLVKAGYKTLRENRIFVCGGSAVVNGLAGFIFGAHERYVNLGITIFVDVIALAWSFSPTQKTSLSSLFGIGNQAATSSSITSGSGTTSAGGEFAIGHAAHIGGALVGFGLGLLYRKLRFDIYVHGLGQNNRRNGDARGGRTLGGGIGAYLPDEEARRLRRSEEMGGDPYSYPLTPQQLSDQTP